MDYAIDETGEDVQAMRCDTKANHGNDSMD